MTAPETSGRLASTSLNDVAYQRIKRSILSLELRPGEYVNEAQICAALELGRTPVHQAFHRLQLEGLVEIVARKGVVVKPMSLDDVVEIIEVRRLNEPYCARLAAERATQADIAEMESLVAGASAPTARKDYLALIEIDRRFHGCIAAAARNKVLAEILARLHDRSLRFWHLALTKPDHLEDVLDQHYDVLDFIKRHDPDGAAASMEGHIESFRRSIINLTR